MRERVPTILVVEDNPDEETMITRAVRQSRLPCELVIARATDEALQFLFGPEGVSCPRVIVTDLRVAPDGGLGFIDRVRAEVKTRLVPIVVLTGAASDEEVAEAYRAGANSFLMKPVTFDEFSQAIAEIVRYWGSLNWVVRSSENPADYAGAR